MKKEFALQIIKKTEDDYNKITSLFDMTRKYPWKEFENVTKYFNPDDQILDIGCGNGRFLEFITSKLQFPINYTGLDISENIIKIAKEKYPNHKFLTGDFLKLPFENETFDTIISIASFHHIPSEELRIEALEEMKRVLKPGGKIIITVWNLRGQKKYQPFLKKQENDYDIGDSLIPWKSSDGKIITERYYHAFTQKEAEDLFDKTGLKIIKSKKTNYNLFFVLGN